MSSFPQKKHNDTHKEFLNLLYIIAATHAAIIALIFLTSFISKKSKIKLRSNKYSVVTFANNAFARGKYGPGFVKDYAGRGKSRENQSLHKDSELIQIKSDKTAKLLEPANNRKPETHLVQAIKSTKIKKSKKLNYSRLESNLKSIKNNINLSKLKKTKLKDIKRKESILNQSKDSGMYLAKPNMLSDTKELEINKQREESAIEDSLVNREFKSDLKEEKTEIEKNNIKKEDIIQTNNMALSKQEDSLDVAQDIVPIVLNANEILANSNEIDIDTNSYSDEIILINELKNNLANKIPNYFHNNKAITIYIDIAKNGKVNKISTKEHVATALFLAYKSGLIQVKYPMKYWGTCLELIIN